MEAQKQDRGEEDGGLVGEWTASNRGVALGLAGKVPASFLHVF